MVTQVTLTLPEDVYEHAKRWATIMHRDVPDTLTDVLRTALIPVHTAPELEVPISSLADRDTLALTTVKMDAVQGQRLELLLEKQQEGTLSKRERAEMLALMQIYDRLWIRQSEALAEAVRRGLREPLSS